MSDTTELLEISPVIPVGDMDKAIAFYERQLGFRMGIERFGVYDLNGAALVFYEDL